MASKARKRVNKACREWRNAGGERTLREQLRSRRLAKRLGMMSAMAPGLLLGFGEGRR
jgi:hypothetical protein